MAFTPPQLRGLEGYSTKWNNDGTYSIILRRRIEAKFLGFLWPVSRIVSDVIHYDATWVSGDMYQSSDLMDSDVKFLEDHIANMWKK